MLALVAQSRSPSLYSCFLLSFSGGPGWLTFLHDWGKPSHYYITQSASPVVYSSGWACPSHAHYVTQCKNVMPTLGIVILAKYLLTIYTNDVAFVLKRLKRKMLIMIASGKAMKQIPFEVYYSYAPSERDEKLRLELERHLMSFVHNGLIAGWHRGEILAGKVTASESLAHLQRAQLILLLVSPDFLSSHETYHFEMKLALERHARGEAYVIPILLRPVFYKNTPFAHLQMLPDNHLPITSWKHQDEAFENVANGLDRVLQRLSQEQTAAVAPHPLSAAQGAHFPDGWSSPSVSSSSIPRCDVLLVTAAQVETQAVLACC